MLNKSIHPEINCSILSTSHEGNAYTNSSIPRLTEKNKANLLLNVQNSSMKHDSDPVNSCTAARTRSVQQWQKRKLFNLSKIEKTSPSIICGCGDSWTPCVLCKRSSPMLPTVTQRQDFRDRVALMDLSFHPVLSFETGKRKYVWRLVLVCMRNVHGCDLRIVKKIQFHLWLAFLKITTAYIGKKRMQCSVCWQRHFIQVSFKITMSNALWSLTTKLYSNYWRSRSRSSSNCIAQCPWHAREQNQTVYRTFL